MRAFALAAALLALLAGMPATADPAYRAYAAPAPPDSIPLSFDDPMFRGVSDSGWVKLSNGGSVARKSIVADGPSASIICQGACTIDEVRVSSHEAVRIADRGTFVIRRSYLEATGSGNDHADVIQTYSPGDCGTISIADTSIVAHNTAATAGMFVSDDWTGIISLSNVVFNGGPFGLRIMSGIGGDNIIAAKNVYFVRPFMFRPVLLQDAGGHRNIVTQWENVRYATVVDGKLVPGNPVPCPGLRCGPANLPLALAAIKAQNARGCGLRTTEQ